jgi:hypothetical protein
MMKREAGGLTDDYFVFTSSTSGVWVSHVELWISLDTWEEES